MRTRTCAFRAAATLLLCSVAAAQTGTITNGVVELAYEIDANQNLHFTSVADVPASGPAASFALGAEDLWKVLVRDPITGNEIGPIGPSDAGVSFTALGPFDPPQTLPDPEVVELVYYWSDFQAAQAPAQKYLVWVYVVLDPGSPLAKIWVGANSITQATPSATWSVLELEAPRLELDFGPSEDTSAHVLSVPFAGGVLLPDPIHNPIVPYLEFATPELSAGALQHPGNFSMQWLSYDDPANQDRLLYLATQDADGWNKAFSLTADEANQDFRFTLTTLAATGSPPTRTTSSRSPWPWAFSAETSSTPPNCTAPGRSRSPGPAAVRSRPTRATRPRSATRT